MPRKTIESLEHKINKHDVCLFDFQITWMIVEIRAGFVLVQFFFTNKGSIFSYTILHLLLSISHLSRSIFCCANLYSGVKKEFDLEIFMHFAKP